MGDWGSFQAGVAHTAQPASAAVTASVSSITIGAAEAFRSHGSEDGGGRHVLSPSTGSPAVHHIPASAGDPAGRFPDTAHRGAVRVTGVSSPNSPAGHIRAGKAPAGIFLGQRQTNVIPFARNLAGGAIAPEAPRTRLGAANTQQASLADCGARRPRSLLLVAGAVIFDLWPVWAVAAVGLLLAGQA